MCLQVRSIIAKRLLESKLTAPSLYVSMDVCLDQLTALRKALAEQVSTRGPDRQTGTLSQQLHVARGIPASP